MQPAESVGPASPDSRIRVATLAAHLLLSLAVSLAAGQGLFNPATAATGGLTLWLAIPPGRAPSLAFGPLFVAAYAIVESLEGRGGGYRFAAALAAASAIGIGLEAWRNRRIWPAIVAGLLTLLALFSARSGGAGTMVPWFADFLPAAWVGPVVIGIRKIVHATFYPLLAFSVLRAEPTAEARGAFVFVTIFAVFDEWRQSAIPGRTGSAWDVLLDLVAAGILLLVLRSRIARRDRVS